MPSSGCCAMVANDAIGELVHLRRREREAARTHANAVRTLESGSRRSVDHGADLGRVRDSSSCGDGVCSRRKAVS
eukprot:6369754-Prymnesium_polylepis.2